MESYFEIVVETLVVVLICGVLLTLMFVSLTDSKRTELMPDVPTFRELGYPDIAGENWYGVFAPDGTPA